MNNELTQYARIVDGMHWTEGCGFIKPQLLRFAVMYQSRAGECCEWYATQAEAQTRLETVKRCLDVQEPRTLEAGRFNDVQHGLFVEPG